MVADIVSLQDGAVALVDAVLTHPTIARHLTRKTPLQVRLVFASTHGALSTDSFM